MTVAILAAAGWILAAAFLGLWLGERGRRIDAQRREGVVPIGRAPRARVKRPEPGPVPHDQALALADEREKWIAETVRDYAVSQEQASADWDAMLAQANIEGAPRWSG